MKREEALRIIKECKEKGFKHTFYTLNEYHTALDVAIKALEQENWIPVSERLPEEREWYLAVFKEKDTDYQLIPRVADYIGENNWRIIDEDGLVKEYRDILECVAWMPLPESYKERGEE